MSAAAAPRRVRWPLVDLAVWTLVALVALGAVAAGGVALTRGEPRPAATTARAPGTDSPPGGPEAPGGADGAAGGDSSEPVAGTPDAVVPKAQDPVVALVQEYDGAYRGTWRNATADTTGPVTLRLRIDPVTGGLRAVADFDGDLFGRRSAKPRRLESTVDLLATSPTSSTWTESFGSVTGRIAPGFAVVLEAPDVPDPGVGRFALTGRVGASQNGFNATFTVAYDDGRSAQGTLTVSCSATGQRDVAVPTLCSP